MGNVRQTRWEAVGQGEIITVGSQGIKSSETICCVKLYVGLSITEHENCGHQMEGKQKQEGNTNTEKTMELEDMRKYKASKFLNFCGRKLLYTAQI